MALFKDDYALVVGIDHYPGFRDLIGAIADAKDFDQWLIDSNTGGGLPEENRRIILSEPDSRRPIQNDIDDALESLIVAIGSNHVRRFYLYFSGHGLSSSRMGADLCLAVWSSLRRNAAIDSQAYYELLAGTGSFDEIVCFLDCCRVRIANTHGQISTLGRPKPDQLTGNERRMVAYSTEYQNAAYEALTDTDEADVRGYFTKALMEALRGKAAQTGGGVPARRLKQYVETRTRELAKAEGRHQQPEVDMSFMYEDEPVFGSALPGRTVEISFEPQCDGHDIEVVGPDDEVVQLIKATGENIEIQLGAGLHMLVDTVNGRCKAIREGDSHVRL